jgi:hypothetical protein
MDPLFFNRTSTAVRSPCHFLPDIDHTGIITGSDRLKRIWNRTWKNSLHYHFNMDLPASTTGRFGCFHTGLVAIESDRFQTSPFLEK